MWLAPVLQRQTQFNAALVQLLNAYTEHAERLHARLRELSGAIVRYAQRVQPLVDARDRVASALATTRSELILESFDRRLESLARRREGLLSLAGRLESVSEEVRTAFDVRLRGSRVHCRVEPDHGAERRRAIGGERARVGVRRGLAQCDAARGGVLHDHARWSL